MTQVKFCGIKRKEDVDYVNQLKPAFMGFVFWPRSKRCISLEQAVELADMVNEETQIVGVFLDQPLEDVIAVAETGCIDMVQLHGNESDRYIRMLRNMTGLPVIKAFTVKTQEDVDKAQMTEADYLMLDSGHGSGETFDWSVLEKAERPYFLAGGLNPSNLREAIERLHPMAVDTSSGIEKDGAKDLALMKEFIGIASQYE